MVRNLEEMCMNAWPSLETILYDGWIIRFAKSYSRRSNSVNAIYDSKENIDIKVSSVEKLYKSKNQKSIFKITPQVCPVNLDSVLEAKGYKAEAETSVQLADLSMVREPRLKTISTSSQLCDQWLQNYCEMNNIHLNDRKTVEEILKSIAPERYFILLKDEEEIIACGLGVLEGEYIGLFDIVVKKEHRGKGYGEQLLLNIISSAKARGAKFAYLQVMCDNPSALKLYEKLGFKELYKYWYRVKQLN